MSTATWIANITGTWENGANWSGGSGSGGIPGLGDNVIFNGTHQGSCSINGNTQPIADLTMTGFHGNLAFNSGGLNVGGNVILSGTATSTTGKLQLNATAGISKTLTTNGVTTLPNIEIFEGCKYTLQDDITCGSLTFLNNAFPGFTTTFDTNGKTCNISSVICAAANPCAILLGASNINLTAASGTVWDITGNFSVTAGTSIIKLSTSSSSTRTFAGKNLVYHTLDYTLSGSTGQLTITGGNTFSTINFSDVSNSRTIQFQDATTTTITTAFNVNGTSGNLVTIANSSTTAGHSHSLTYSGGGLISLNYLSVSHSTAVQTLTWYAGPNSVDGGSNTNWLFSAPSTGNSQLMLMGVGS